MGKRGGLPTLWFQLVYLQTKRTRLRSPEMNPCQDFPPVPDGEVPLQRNEGKWEFTLDESEDGCVRGGVNSYFVGPVAAFQGVYASK
jgi:hypothetical protein